MSKNLGQVAGLFVANTPPENIKLIWYDETPSQNIHKVFNPTTSLWETLDKYSVLGITYLELTNLASTTGLGIAKYYRITDRQNVLALSVTQTKIQYTDVNGNITIDDLGSNIQYIVSSSNLIIDDIQGVFDVLTKRILFTFEIVNSISEDDYVLAKGIRGGITKFIKFKLSKLISTVTNNSISWNGGLYFNFNSALNNKLNQNGGAVSFDSYEQDMTTMNANIENIAENYQNLVDNVNEAISNGLAATEVYSKQLPTALDVNGEPVDIAQGDSLFSIVQKSQRFFNKFKFATGSRISQGFTDNTQFVYVNNNDTVESAFGKINFWLKNLWNVVIPSGFTPFDSDSDIATGDSTLTAFRKIQRYINRFKLATGSLIQGFVNNLSPKIDIVDGDTTQEALRKTQASITRLNKVTNYAYAQFYTNHESDGDITVSVSQQTSNLSIEDIDIGEFILKALIVPFNGIVKIYPSWVPGVTPSSPQSGYIDVYRKVETNQDTEPPTIIYEEVLDARIYPQWINLSSYVEWSIFSPVYCRKVKAGESIWIRARRDNAVAGSHCQVTARVEFSTLEI